MGGTSSIVAASVTRTAEQCWVDFNAFGPNVEALANALLGHAERFANNLLLLLVKSVTGLHANTMANPASAVMSASSNFVIPGCTLLRTILQTDDKAGLRNLPIGNPPG